MVEFAPDIRLKKYAAKAAKILYEFLDPEEKANISSIPLYPGSGEDIFIEDFTLQFLNPNQGEQYDPCIRWEETRNPQKEKTEAIKRPENMKPIERTFVASVMACLIENIKENIQGYSELGQLPETIQIRISSSMELKTVPPRRSSEKMIEDVKLLENFLQEHLKEEVKLARHLQLHETYYPPEEEQQGKER
ncbi:hypothetical protein RLOatenuis_1570 [Rickettsiales bacterium]|nr:hypothetical protein RLOatenuis_1570 [Rickettsiales bacterium]